MNQPADREKPPPGRQSAVRIRWPRHARQLPDPPSMPDGLTHSIFSGPQGAQGESARVDGYVRWSRLVWIVMSARMRGRSGCPSQCAPVLSCSRGHSGCGLCIASVCGGTRFSADEAKGGQVGHMRIRDAQRCHPLVAGRWAAKRACNHGDERRAGDLQDLTRHRYAWPSAHVFTL